MACVAAAAPLEWAPERLADREWRCTCRRRSVVDVAFASGAGVIPDASSRAKAIQRLRLGDIAFRFLTQTAAIGVLIILGGVMFSLIEGSLPALQAFGFGFLLAAALESGHREVRRAGADLRHDRHLAHRDADRGADRPADRDVPHRAVPACGCGARSASPSSCWPASRASSTASGACSCSRRSCRTRCSRS